MPVVLGAPWGTNLAHFHLPSHPRYLPHRRFSQPAASSPYFRLRSLSGEALLILPTPLISVAFITSPPGLRAP